jgi:F420 biosynthesis protein FbiB-like protein
MIADSSWLADVIRSRRSVRHFRREPISHATIEGLIEAARWAPSAHNAQPWRFVVLEDQQRRRDLAHAMASRFQTDLLADGVPEGEALARAVRAQTRLSEAPAAVLACLTLEDAQVYPDEQRAAAEHEMAVQSTALAVENLLLTAHQAGLGACWLCSPLFCPDLVVRELDLPREWEPQALILLGMPERSPTAPERRPLADILVWR